MHAAAFDLDIERRAGVDADDALHVGETVDFLAIDSHHQVTRLEAGGLRGACRLHRIDAGAGGLLADGHEDAGENGDRQDEIRDRAGRHHGGTRADRLVDKANRSLGLVHGGRGRMIGHARRIVVAEEFHIATERNRGDFPARSVTVIKADDFGTKTNRESEYPDTAPAGHQEMAKLMKENDNCQHKQERNQITDEVAAECAQAPHNVHTHHTLVPPLWRPRR